MIRQSQSIFAKYPLFLTKLALVIGAASVFFLPSCSVFQKILAPSMPEFQINDFSVKDVGLDGITFHIDAELLNHLPVPLPESIMNMKLNINDQQLTTFKTSPIAVKARGKTPVPVDMTLRYIDIYRIVSSMSLIESFKVGFHGSADFPVSMPGLPDTISVPFDVEKTVPSFLPDISLGDINIRRPDLSSLVGALFTSEIPLGLDLDLIVANKGGAKFNFDDMGYTMLLGNKPVFKGTSQTAETAADGKSTTIRISTDVPLKESVKAILPLLQGNSIQYELDANAAFKFAGVDLNKISLPVKKKGAFSF